ncbi:MAG: hypothetical protein ACK493_11610 [Planctomycetota bacterium]|jgi:hypothetical protein|nr:hypothetical protein [Blastopirellula sp.]
MPQWLILLLSTLALVVITELMTKKLETWLSQNNPGKESNSTEPELPAGKPQGGKGE